MDWVRKILESRLAGSFVDKLKGVLESVGDGSDMKDVAGQIYDLFAQGIVKSKTLPGDPDRDGSE